MTRYNNATLNDTEKLFAMVDDNCGKLEQYDILVFIPCEFTDEKVDWVLYKGYLLKDLRKAFWFSAKKPYIMAFNPRLEKEDGMANINSNIGYALFHLENKNIDKEWTTEMEY